MEPVSTWMHFGDYMRVEMPYTRLHKAGTSSNLAALALGPENAAGSNATEAETSKDDASVELEPGPSHLATENAVAHANATLESSARPEQVLVSTPGPDLEFPANAAISARHEQVLVSTPAPLVESPATPMNVVSAVAALQSSPLEPLPPPAQDPVLTPGPVAGPAAAVADDALRQVSTSIVVSQSHALSLAIPLCTPICSRPTES